MVFSRIFVRDGFTQHIHVYIYIYMCVCYISIRNTLSLCARTFCEAEIYNFKSRIYRLLLIISQDSLNMQNDRDERHYRARIIRYHRDGKRKWYKLGETEDAWGMRTGKEIGGNSSAKLYQDKLLRAGGHVHTHTHTHTQACIYACLYTVESHRRRKEEENGVVAPSYTRIRFEISTNSGYCVFRISGAWRKRLMENNTFWRAALLPREIVLRQWQRSWHEKTTFIICECDMRWIVIALSTYQQISFSPSNIEGKVVYQLFASGISEIYYWINIIYIG